MGEDGRVFLRGMSSKQYGLSEFRNLQLSQPRVRGDEVVVDNASVAHSGDSEESSTYWRVGPGDEQFVTQSLQIHFVELPPGGSNHGHGHQNEALFYILEGKGYEIHDGQRYDWQQDDLVVVHDDSVHRHFNASDQDRAVALVMKAKATWMMLGLLQQGRSAPFADDGRFGPRQDWSQLWTAGATERKKVVSQADTRWEDTPDGHIRVLSAPERTDVRAFSVDVYEQRVDPGESTTPHLHMADEVLYVLGGQGHSLQWQVEAEIAEKYYARIAIEPTRWELKKGDVLYVPQNTVHQFVNTGDQPLRLLSAQNRLFKLLGYDRVVRGDVVGGELQAMAAAGV
jgi:quercetin dioxygenase-like cupin family protein